MTLPRPALLLCLLMPLLPAARAAEVEIAGLTFTVPKGWAPVPPATPMRAAQWIVPARGDGEAGEGVIFFFGPGQGGGAPANIARWSGTITSPQGAPAVGQTTVRKVGADGAITATELDIYGTYANAMGVPGLPALPKPGYGLAGVVLEYPGGPLFFRLLGPEALVRKQLPAFARMIDSARAKAPAAAVH